MKVAILSLLVALSITAVLSAPGDVAPTGPIVTPEMIAAFIPTPEEIAALQALHTTPAPGTIPTPPSGPPTMPAAVAALVDKYRNAAAAFITTP